MIEFSTAIREMVTGVVTSEYKVKAVIILKRKKILYVARLHFYS